MKIPQKHTGTELSIFSEMTQLSIQHNAINLAQGFPDYEIDEHLKNFLAEATQKNYNQYMPMAGNPALLEQLIRFNSRRKIPLHLSEKEITVTAGGTYGIYASLSTILLPGDEVIVLEPCYDSYIPSIETNGGKAVSVQLNKDFTPNFPEIQKVITEKTKAIIVNTPHNPSGKIWTQEDWNELWEIIKDREIFVISDEVYDLLCFDEHTFYSAQHHPELKKRSFSIFSFGKMFHITGWKTGYVVASEELSQAFRKIHQYLLFCVNSPSQYALAKYLEIFDADENRVMMQKKRDFFLEQFQDLPFTYSEKSEGSYFQTMSYENISTLRDKDFSVWLTKEKGVSVVPVSAFYKNEKNTGKVRFCFAKKEETIIEAAKRLRENL